MNKYEYMTNAFKSELKPRARLVLNCLALHSNKEMTCFPSIKTIAKECGYSVSTVKRALNDLEKLGHIEKIERYDERKNGGQTSNLYVLKVVDENKNKSNKDKEENVTTDKRNKMYSTVREVERNFKELFNIGNEVNFVDYFVYGVNEHINNIDESYFIKDIKVVDSS